MIFSKKEEIRTPFTLQQCQDCKKEIKREFKIDDFVFKDSSMCEKCNQPMLIVKIFGEIVKEM